MAGIGQNLSAALLMTLEWIWYFGTVARERARVMRARGRAGAGASVCRHALKDRPGFSLKIDQVFP